VHLSSKLLLLISLPAVLYSGVAVVPGDEQYYKYEEKELEFIYTEQNRYAAEQAKTLEPLINQAYRRSFGYRLDAPLHVGIISQQNQIANGFSTQYPYNLQINYIGGSLKSDYFASTSWLNTLLYHETAHNYQLNAKASSVTRGMSTLMGNGILVAGFFPLFSVPNVAISSYLLEGNAVLNESWQGNGGRLYSGRFMAESVMQARAGQITPQFLYNQTTHKFPYYDRHYIIGGFFQLYLAEKYGLERVNSFFYNHSRSWLWPFRTNHIFRLTFGESFETAMSGYAMWLLESSQGFVEAEGDPVVTSHYFSPLNSNGGEIFFMVTDAQRAPELVRIGKKEKTLKRERNSYIQGKVIESTEGFTTQASGFVKPSRIAIGLFDEEGEIVNGTASRVIQGYLNDGKAVYFDVPSSFDQPQLYVGDRYYAQINSSVHIDRGEDLYYFVQQGKKRTLYRNRTPLYSYEGYYGIVCDVDSRGNVYFVANSRKGSTLFCLGRSGARRVSPADNVVEARLINDEELLVAAIGSGNYYYVVNRIESRDEEPWPTRFFFEEEPGFGGKNEEEESGPLTLEEAYSEALNLHYAGSTLYLGAGSKNGNTLFTYAFAASFIDPLLSNAFSLFSQRGMDEVGIAGISYINNAHLLEFGGSLYGVYSEGDANTYHDYNTTTKEYSPYGRDIAKESRDYGLSAYLRLPVIKSGYRRGNISLGYYQDYDDNARSPLVLSADIGRYERYGQAMFDNYVNAISLYTTYDRGDHAYGVDYTFSHDLPYKLFVGLRAKGVRTDYARVTTLPADADYTRGVQFTGYQSLLFNDPATVVMPSLEYTRFVRQAAVGELSVKKQFDGALLYFTFPLSLTREALYLKHRYYNILDFGEADEQNVHTYYNETTVGATLEMLLLNRLTVPLNFEYIYNPDTQEIHNFRFYLGSYF